METQSSQTHRNMDSRNTDSRAAVRRDWGGAQWGQRRKQENSWRWAVPCMCLSSTLQKGRIVQFICICYHSVFKKDVKEEEEESEEEDTGFGKKTSSIFD